LCFADSTEKEEVLPGVDRIKTVEAQFCELCQRFLPRLDDLQKAKAIHCRSYVHKKNHHYEQRKLARVKARSPAKQEPEEKLEDEDKVNFFFEIKTLTFKYTCLLKITNIFSM